MFFCFFMLAAVLLIPLIMIVFGSAFLRSAPKEINFLFGYRTTLSMKNRDTWEFAHRTCGAIWRRTGLCLIPVFLISMLLVLGKSEEAIGSCGSALCFVGIAFLMLSIVLIERTLRKRFDSNGNLRQNEYKK